MSRLKTDAIRNVNASVDGINLDTSGNVGLGTTSPNTKLHVEGTGTIAEFKSTNNNYLLQLKGNNSANYVYLGTTSSNDYLIANNTNGSGFAERLRIDSSGRLLLGTTTEGSTNADELTINTASGHGGMTIRNDSSSNGNIWFSDGTSGAAEYAGYVQYDHSADALKLASGAALALTLDNSQNATFAGTVSDSKGDLRKIIQNTQGSTYTLVAADAGKHILASGNITVPDSVFSAGDAITIINNTGSNLTITKGTNMYNAGDASNANRTLATRGMATLLFTAADTSYISGAGLS